MQTTVATLLTYMRSIPFLKNLFLIFILFAKVTLFAQDESSPKKSQKKTFAMSFLAVDSKTNNTIAAIFSAVEVNTGLRVVFMNDLNSLQSQATFDFKALYNIEATLPGYKSQSLSLQIDNPEGMLPVSIIKLEPISSNFKIEITDLNKGLPIETVKISIIETLTNEKIPVKDQAAVNFINLEDGKKYAITVEADDYKKKEIIVDKTAKITKLEVKLVPKQNSIVSFKLIDAETSNELTGSFMIVSEKTSKRFSGTTYSIENKFSIKLEENDNLKVEANTDGYTTTRFLAEIKDLVIGKNKEIIIKMQSDKFPLIVKIIDKETGERIEKTNIKILDTKYNTLINATKTPIGEYLAQLKRFQYYEISTEIDGYVAYKQSIDNAPENGILIIKLEKKKGKGIVIKTIDSETGKEIVSKNKIRFEKSDQLILLGENQKEFSVSEENFMVQTFSKGFKPVQNIYKLSSFTKEKDNAIEIPLTRSNTIVQIIAQDKESGKSVEEIVVFNLANDKTFEKIKTPIAFIKGETSVELNPNENYLLKIMAIGYEDFQQNITGNNLNTIICKLIPRQNVANLVITALDSLSNKTIESVFTITQKRNKETVFSEKATLNKPSVTHKLKIEEDYLLTTEAKGYPTKTETLPYKIIGKTYNHTVKLYRELSIITLKASDATSKKVLKAVYFSITDLTSDKPLAASTSIYNGDYNAELKPTYSYIIKAKCEGYQDFEEKIIANTDDLEKNIEMKPLLKHTFYMYAIDNIAQNAVYAQIKIYDKAGELLINGKTTPERAEMSIQLLEKTGYTYTVKANGYKEYFGSLYPEGEMLSKKALIPVKLEKDKSKFIFRIIDADTRNVMYDCGIKLIDAKTNTPIDLLKSGDDYYADLLPFTFYKLVIDAKDYGTYQGRIDPQLLITKEDRKKDIQLSKKRLITNIEPLISKTNTTTNLENKNTYVKAFERIEIGKKVLLNNVYFEQSSFILQKESFIELDKLAAMLSQNPSSKIQIAGHTDNIGDSRLNQALSENRAKVILNYLLSKGIDEERLSYKGFGGTQPIVENNTEENRKKNRRVEILGIK